MYKRNKGDTLQKISEPLIRHNLQNPCQNIPVMESVFNEIIGMDSRPAFLLKRSSHQGHFLVDILEFSVLLQSGLMWIPFLVNYLQRCTLLKHCCTIRQVVFGTFSENNLWWSQFIVDMQSIQCRIAALLK